MNKNSRIKRNRLLALCEAQNHRCAYCLVPLEYTIINGYIILSTGRNKPTIDHLIPRSQKGPNTRKNSVIACETCNNGRDIDDPIKYYQARIGNFLGANKICNNHRKYYLST